MERIAKKIADEKMLDLKKKQSINSSGKNNPMYGKPAPQGSGNGWKGWYKNWHFRSLRELQFYIQMTENEKRHCEPIHLFKKFRILYKLDGAERTYSPDFLLDKKN